MKCHKVELTPATMRAFWCHPCLHPPYRTWVEKEGDESLMINHVTRVQKNSFMTSFKIYKEGKIKVFWEKEILVICKL